MELKYVIAGAGATGGSLGAFLAADGRNVTFLARGAQLEAFLENGISMRGTVKGDFTVAPVKAMTMEAYHEQPDVIFVCVKSYSLEDAIELVKRTGSSKTVVIPILNIYGTGERMQKELPGVTVTDGCIYVAAYVSAPGEITHGGDIFRVVYGLRPGQKTSDAVMEKLSQIKRDCDHAGISGEYTDHVRRDTFQKFMYTVRWLPQESIIMRRLAISRKQASPGRLLSLWTGSFWSFRKQWDSMFRKIWWRQIFPFLRV